MINSLILLIEVGLVALLLLLAFRMLTLVRNEPFVPVSAITRSGTSQQQPMQAPPVRHHRRIDSTAKDARPGAPDKCGLITQLHILLCLQERDCRESGLSLDTGPHGIREFSVAWLYGAACALCDKSQRHSDALVNLVSQLASRKTGIRQTEAVQALSTLTGSSTLLACFRHGVEGAEYWREHRFVPQQNGLYTAVTSNAFI